MYSSYTQFVFPNFAGTSPAGLYGGAADVRAISALACGLPDQQESDDL
jgi:hypothetical protein